MNSIFRCVDGRGDEPLSSDTPRCHPTPMLTGAMIAATARQHKIHGGMRLRQCLEIAIRALTLSESDLDIETGGGGDVVGR